MKTFSSFRSAIRQETKAAGAANSHLAAAFQVPSSAVVSPRMRRGRRAHSPSSPSARRSGNQRPRNALSRPEPPFGLSPVFPEALLPPGDPTRSVGSGRTPTRPRCALRVRGVRSWCEGAAPTAPAAPGLAAPPRASGFSRAPGLSVYVLFFSVSTLTSFSFFFPSLL